MPFPNGSAIQSALDSYNQFLAALWQAKNEEIPRRLIALAADQAAEREDLDSLRFEVLDFAGPPSLERGAERPSGQPGSMIVTIPAEGGWRIKVRARIKRKVFLLGSWHTIRVHIENLRIRAEIGLSWHGTDSFTMGDQKVEVQLGNLEVRPSNWLLWGLSRIFNPILEEWVEHCATVALAEVLPGEEVVAAAAAAGLGSATPVYNGEPPDLIELETEARAQSALIRAHHMPWGTILSAIVPNENPLAKPAILAHYGDSAIWTGHYIAAEAFRYKVTGETEAADNAEHALQGLRALIHLAGVPGLLSRVLVPVGSDHHQELLEDVGTRTERLFEGEYQGTRYHGVGHITRDQYTGALLGTGLAAHFFEAGGRVAELAKDLALTMVDYLIAQSFSPLEANPGGDPDEGFTSVTFAMNPAHILAALQLAHSLKPGAYAERLEAFTPASGIFWLFEWLPSLDPHGSYYKFNLEHGMHLLLLLLEKDPERKRTLAHGFTLLRRALKNHANAYFNLVELLTLGDEPDLLSRSPEALATESRHLISDMFQRPLYLKARDLARDDTITTIGYHGLSHGDKSKAEIVATQAIPLSKRPGSDFIWQRSPFNLNHAWPLPNSGLLRPPGIDRILPYWMWRYWQARHGGLA